MQVRPATSADIAALLALDRGAPTAAHWSEADYLRPFSEAGRVALVIEEDCVQGFIVGRNLGAEWEIENIVVAGSARRRGLGTRLIETLLNLARKQEAQAVWLEVRQSNQAGRALYCKLGFVESGRRRSYYQNPEEDAILYKKLFPPGPRKGIEGGGGV